MPLPTMQMPKIEDDVVIFQGGLDLATPSLKLRPGHVRSGQNWQCVANEDGGGYERTGGYERFAGGQAPSSAIYSTLVFSSWVHTPAQWQWATNPLPEPDALPGFPPTWEGAFIKGQTSNALGVIVFYVDPTIPDYYVDQQYVVVIVLEGLFQIGETVVIPGADQAGNIYGAVATVGVLTALVPTVPITARNNARLLARAANLSRGYNGTVPGSGPILGICSAVFSGVRQVYAIRNTEDGTAAKLYKTDLWSPYNTTPIYGRWVAVPLHYEIRFTAGGTTVPAEGATLTQGAVTATVKRVVHESGQWETNTAAGRLIITAALNFAAGAATVGGVTLTLAGVQTAITLLPNGRYQFDVANFAGQLSSKRIYGASGVQRAFEFDGEVYVPIETKAQVDTPKFIRKHHDHLLVAIGSSVMGSGPGTPYKFGSTDGGFEVTAGDEVTGLLVQPGNQDTAACAILARNSSGVLYGTSATDFNYKAFPSLTGSLPYMQANLDKSYLFDDRGVLSLAAAQEYGNFQQATLTSNLNDFLTPRKSLAVGCCVNAERSQFRLFFSDGSALYLTMVNGRMVGALPQQFYHPLACVWSGEDASGNEETFAGSADGGYIFHLDRGSSWDGQPIEHQLIFNQHFMKAPSIKKQFRNGSLEVQSSFYAEFALGYILSYGSTNIFQPQNVTYSSGFQVAGTWDQIVWDNFYWDGVTLSPTSVEINGKAEAIQMVIAGSSDFIYPFRLSSLITHYNFTRRTR